MNVLLKGPFTREDLKEIGILIRKIDLEHGGEIPFHMITKADDDISEPEAVEMLHDIFPALEGVPYEIKLFKRGGIEVDDKQ